MELYKKGFKNEQLFYRFIRKSIHCVYPARCLICQQLAQKTHDLCDSCFQGLPWNKHSCRQCALPFHFERKMLAAELDILCGRCQKKTPGFDFSYSLFRYEADIVPMIQRLKFKQNLVYSRLLGGMLAESISEWLNETGCYPDYLMPVPLHKKRLRQRGFNQSIELARALSKMMDIPISIDEMIRVRETASQSGLDAEQRKKNIRGAFTLQKRFSAKHVAIIDDVVTTTSTVNEIAGVLKRNGVKRVDVYSIARA